MLRLVLDELRQRHRAAEGVLQRSELFLEEQVYVEQQRKVGKVLYRREAGMRAVAPKKLTESHQTCSSRCSRSQELITRANSSNSSSFTAS